MRKEKRGRDTLKEVGSGSVGEAFECERKWKG